MRWATHVSARMLAGAFAVAWEWANTELVSELSSITVREERSAPSRVPEAADWTGTATAAVPIETVDEYALVAAGESPLGGSAALTRLGPLPPLQMDPNTGPILTRYRTLARERYGRDVTADGATWATWP